MRTETAGAAGPPSGHRLIQQRAFACCTLASSSGKLTHALSCILACPIALAHELATPGVLAVIWNVEVLEASGVHNCVSLVGSLPLITGRSKPQFPIRSFLSISIVSDSSWHVCNDFDNTFNLHCAGGLRRSLGRKLLDFRSARHCVVRFSVL